MSLVDWGVARGIAGRVAGSTPPVRSVAGLAGLCADAERRVAAYARLAPAAPLPLPEAVDRRGWIDANLRSMRGVIDPLADRLGGRAGRMTGPVRIVGSLALAAEVGGIVGLLSQRVLGQYDVPMLDPEGEARLLFVLPNLDEAAERLEVPGDEMLRWVALHEVTHAVQFSSVPWLRAHVADLLGRLLGTLDRRPGVFAVAGRLRRDGVVGAFLGPERRYLLDRIQATMALVEGHAEHVMDATGADVLPSLPRLRSGLERRRRNRPPAWRVLERLLGLELKMRQYEVGKRFCDHVVAEAGVDGLNRAWASPEALPTWAEMQAPEQWRARGRVSVSDGTEHLFVVCNPSGHWEYKQMFVIRIETNT